MSEEILNINALMPLYEDDRIADPAVIDSNILATPRGHVNEIHMARVLNGGKHVSPEMNKKHDNAAALLSPEEVKHQHKRAEKMAQKYVKMATTIHGYTGKIKEVHVTATDGVKKATGLDVGQNHPADIVVKWSGHKVKGHTHWHGISAKSVATKGVDRIATRSAKAIGSSVGVDLHTHHEKRSEAFAKTHKIGHMTTKDRKATIKASTKLTAAADTEGGKSTIRTRDTYHGHLSGLEPKAVKAHLHKEFFRTGSGDAETLPYVIASGSGNGGKKGYAGLIKSPSDSDHHHLINAATHFSFEKSGTSKIRVFAHGKGYEDGAHVISLETKHDRQKMASNQMILGREGTLASKLSIKGKPVRQSNLSDVVAGIQTKSNKQINKRTKNV